MAYARVQAAEAANPGVATLTGVAGGNALVLVACAKGTDGTTVWSISDDTDGAMTLLHSVEDHGTNANDGFAVFVILGVTAGTHTFTDNSSGAYTASDVFLMEISGMTAPEIGGTSLDFTDTTSPYNTGNITPTAEALLLVITGTDLSTGTVTPGDNYTQELAGARELGFSRIAATGTYNGDWLMTQTTRTVYGSFVALQEPAVVGGGLPALTLLGVG